MPFANYWSEIVGSVPRIDALNAQNIVNRAWAAIQDERTWSFLIGEGVLLAPQIITSGTVTVTQFNNTVSLDSTANPALNNLNTPFITSRQFRCGLGGGSVYNITGYNNGAATLTLDRPYLEPSGAGQPYQVYRCYYQPCDMNGNFITDFDHFIVILNPIDGYAITGENLLLTRQEIDARDPTRGAQDLPYTACVYKSDPNGYPIYELWPHPTSQRGYPYAYMRRGSVLSASQDIPGTFPSDVLIDKAKLIAYEWAMTNAGRFPELKGVDWALLSAATQKRYDRHLQFAKVKDDNLLITSFLPGLRDYLAYPPISADFFQSHDVGGWFSGGFG